MISEQLQNELDQEAKAEAKKLTCRVPMFKLGYEGGYGDGGAKYAEKWQEEKELRERYEKALIKIVSLSCRVDDRNAILELKSIASMVVAPVLEAREALTPKTSTDDTDNG